MKTLLYIIAGLLVAIWSIIFLSFNASEYVHVLLAVAAIVLLIPPLMTGQKHQPNIPRGNSYDNL